VKLFGILDNMVLAQSDGFNGLLTQLNTELDIFAPKGCDIALGLYACEPSKLALGTFFAIFC